MAIQGTRTTNIPRASAMDEVLGNVTQDGVSSTVRVPVEALATQLAATGPFIAGNTIYCLTRPEMEAFAPEVDRFGALVLRDQDREGGVAANNGYWRWGLVDTVWEKGRGFRQTFGEFTNFGGTANDQTAELDLWVDPSEPLVYFAFPEEPNTGPMKLNGIDVVNKAGNPLSSGEWDPTGVMFVEREGIYRMIISADAEASAAQSASEAAQSAAEALADANRTATNALAVVDRAWFKTVADLRSDNNSVIGYNGSGADFIVTEGDVIEAQGFRYEVAADSATDDWLFETAGGVLLLPLPDECGRVSFLQFGVSEDGTAAENQPGFEAWIAYGSETGMPLVGPSGSYDHSDTLHFPGGTDVLWLGTNTVKRFDGIGVLYTGAANLQTINGLLIVEKGEGGTGPVPQTLTLSADGGADGGRVVGLNDNDIGVVFRGNRINQSGRIYSRFHQGDGIVFDMSAGGNANGNRYEELWSFYNGKSGFGTSGAGSSDDSSVWRIAMRSYGNWKEGVRLDDDFNARQWSGWSQNEGNALDGVSDGVYLGGLTYSDFHVYSEQQNGVVELRIASSSVRSSVFDLRNSNTVNESADCILRWGSGAITPGSNPLESETRALAVNNEGEYVIRRWQGTSNNTILERRAHWDGVEYLSKSSSDTGISHRVGRTNGEILTQYGGIARRAARSANGTFSAPTAKAAGESVSVDEYWVGTGAAFYRAAYFLSEAVSVGGGNKASVDLIYATTPIGASAPVEAVKLRSDGQIELLQAGDGIIMRSPDGTAYKLSIANGGSVVIGAA